MVSLRNISKTYKGRSLDVCALSNVNIEISSTGLIFILGESGSGKSTIHILMVRMKTS